MAPRKRVSKKKDPTWDEIGKMVGKKVENYEKSDCFQWKKPWVWHHHSNVGGFGRFWFICGLFLAFHSLGMFVGLPWYVIAMIIVGFTFMKF